MYPNPTFLLLAIGIILLCIGAFKKKKTVLIASVIVFLIFAGFFFLGASQIFE